MIHFLSALDEKEYPIAQANAPIDKKGNFTTEEVAVRIAGEASQVGIANVKYMDVSPKRKVASPER
jgi:DNA-directed RNA polymerase subunit beta